MGESAAQRCAWMRPHAVAIFFSTLADNGRTIANDRAAIAKRPGRFPTPAFQAALAPDPGCTCFARPKIRAKGNAMSTKLARSIVPTTETCPNCKGEMMVTEVAPIFFTENLEGVTYRCKGCGSELKRTFKRRSRTWQLIHYNPELPGLRHPFATSRRGTVAVS